MQGVLRQKAAPTNLDVYTVLGHVQRTHLIVKDMHFREISREAEMAEMRKAIAEIHAAVVPAGAPAEKGDPILRPDMAGAALLTRRAAATGVVSTKYVKIKDEIK